MRKIITTTFVTLDGVMQAPGGKEEDTAGGFAYGGWQISFPSDEGMDSKLSEFMNTPFELLLGKKTYDIFASYWPHATTDLEVANPFNTTKKYAVSHESFEPSWQNSFCITGDVVAQIEKLKEEDGPDLWVYGSGDLIQTLLKHHLIDRMHLWIYPITLGSGKKLFAEGTQAENFKLVDSRISTTGVIFATYEPAGKLVPSNERSVK
ncbi:MAG: bifunctional deaminase-reductase domain protein [Candidatus Adlerbacteria bacterium]|nr:bifunctional deaminase-reductase domain protein [Candidatus Adlerbacteria bacterium]